MSDVLDLDWELACHLPDADSFQHLKGEQFSDKLIVDDAIRKVWEWQVGHDRKNGKPASKAVLEDQFGEQLDDPQTAIADLLTRMRERYIRNEAQGSYEDLARLAATDPASFPKKMLDEGRRLNEITSERGESFGQHDFDRAIQEYDEKATAGQGPSLGFTELDLHFHGQRGLTFLIASPKTYKSWFSINAVLSNIMTGKMPWLYSLELQAGEALWRLYCMKADIPYWKYLKGSLDADDRKRFEEAAKDLASYGDYRVEKPDLKSRSVAQLVERAVNGGADCIFIDQLQYVEDRNGNSLGGLNDTGKYFEACNELRDYSDQVPIFVVHQFNRTTMNADAMPEMSQAKGSSAIEETATLGLGLWANKDMRQSNVVELGTLLSRHFTWPRWEAGIELSRGCRLTMNGEIVD